MKTLIYVPLFLFFYGHTILAQIDSTYLEYYPLHTNNYWQYFERTWENTYPPWSETKYFSVEVLGDTLLSNGNRYKILEQVHLDTTQNTYYFYERIDTLTGNVYRYSEYHTNNEYLLDSLKSLAGDTSQSRRAFIHSTPGYLCIGILQDTLLGTITTSLKFEALNPIFQVWHFLTRGFGLSKTEYYHCFGGSILELKYARIDGVEYGIAVPIIKEEDDIIINNIELYSNYPNPFNSTTTIKFNLSHSMDVLLDIYSIDGRKIENLVQEKLNVGTHRYRWNASEYSSGFYIYQLKAGKQILKGKCIYIK